MEKWCRAGNAFLPHSRGLENMSNATCATCIALHRDTVSCGVGFFVVLAVLWCSWGEESQAEPGKLLMGLLCITTVFLVCVEGLLSFVGVK